MVLFFILLTIVFVYFFKPEKKLLSVNGTRILQVVHLIACLLVGSILFLKHYHLSFRGYITEKIIYQLFYFSALVLLVFGSQVVVRGIQRIYYSIFLFFPILLVFLLAIPFLGLAVIFTLQDEFFGDAAAIEYSDRHFRIETPFTGILGNTESRVLIVKQGILEYEDQVLPLVATGKNVRYKISKESSEVIFIQTSGIFFPDKEVTTRTLRIHLNHPL